MHIDKRVRQSACFDVDVFARTRAHPTCVDCGNQLPARALCRHFAAPDSQRHMAQHTYMAGLHQHAQHSEAAQVCRDVCMLAPRAYCAVVAYR